MGSTIRAFDPASAQAPATASPRSLVASPNVAPPVLPGLDVSGWQTNINWSQVAANGAKFAYVKATESTDYRSSQFASQYNGSYAAGLTRGAYHFAIPNESSGAAQANYFVDNGGGWTQDGRTLPPLLDIEFNPYGATCYGLSAAQMVSWIADFSNTVYNRTGRYPAIYTNTNWWVACTGNSAAFGTNPLFIARYPSNVASGAGTLPAGWGAYTMWQWSNAGIFPGDQDVFNGGTAALQLLATTGRTMPQPVVGGGDLNGDGKPDLLARKPDGSLWFYAGIGKTPNGAGYLAAKKIASGMGIYNQILIPGDITGDGKADVLARRTDGALVLFAGTGIIDSGHSGLAPAVTLGYGWDAYTDIIASGDVNGDHKADLLARRPDGSLWRYSGTGQVSGSDVGFLNGVKVGLSWNVFTQVVGAGDLDHDGWADLVALRPDGSLWLYRGSSTGYAAGVTVSVAGLSPSDLLIPAGDADGDGSPDLLTRTASGALYFHAGTIASLPGYGAPQTVGAGWQSFSTVIGAGDLNGDADPDIVTIRGDGTLWSYRGKGSSAGVNNSYLSGTLIGWGWSSFVRVIDAGDVDGNGTGDLVAVRSDGTLWLYLSTGTVASGQPTYEAGRLIGTGWTVFDKIIAGDFDGDGKRDLLATRTDGSLWFYPGIPRSNGSGWSGPGALAGVGWSGFTGFVTSGDSNGDGKTDLVAKRGDGTLWFYAGLGKTSTGTPGFRAGVQVGSGWGTFTTATGTGDRSSGRSGDLLGITPGGALLYYPDKPVKAPGYGPSIVAGTGWGIFG
ncbi:MAG: VCBS repeat-containing protein [Leifsonia sp.]|nr:VCBS repeat-containing protein [Leifsonia sp.]